MSSFTSSIFQSRDTNLRQLLTRAVLGLWTSHLMEAELLRAAQGIQTGLHLVEERAALQDLLLQSFEVVNVAHSVAAMTVGE